MNVIHIKAVEELLFNEEVAIYGAASTGEFCYNLLKGVGCKVRCFIDDDINKIGKEFLGIPVCSSSEYLQGKDNYVIIIGSIYSVSITKKLEQTKESEKIILYYIQELYEHDKYELQKDFMIMHNPSFVWGNIEKLYDICPDDASHRIIDTMKFVYKNNYPHFDVYREICTEEEQYFTSDILRLFGNNEVSILDAGAYHGEILSDINRHKLHIKDIYLIEADAENYRILTGNIDDYMNTRFSGGLHPINKGLWDSSGYVYMEGDGDTSRVTCNTTDKQIPVTTIDEIVRERIDFIKMDIEGAEMHALRGGINTIQRYRPALAISIYHSPEDFVGIPLFLNEKLVSYRFQMLHHTNEYVETTLYGMPE